MKKKILTILTIVYLSLGIFSLIFTPFTSPKSPLYSETFDKIVTELVVTVQAAETYCEEDECNGPTNCQQSTERYNCDLGDNECTNKLCGA